MPKLTKKIYSTDRTKLQASFAYNKEHIKPQKRKGSATGSSDDFDKQQKFLKTSYKIEITIQSHCLEAITNCQIAYQIIFKIRQKIP